MKKLILKNYFFLKDMADREDPRFVGLQDWLNKLLLHGKESRARTRFIKELTSRLQEIQEESLKILKENAEKKIIKDKKGEILEKIVYFDENSKETTDPAQGKRFKLKDLVKYNKEYNEYVNESYVIDITPANQETIYAIRDLLLNTEEKFIGAQAELYNEWCEAFEGIS